MSSDSQMKVFLCLPFSWRFSQCKFSDVLWVLASTGSLLHICYILWLFPFELCYSEFRWFLSKSLYTLGGCLPVMWGFWLWVLVFCWRLPSTHSPHSSLLSPLWIPAAPWVLSSSMAFLHWPTVCECTAWALLHGVGVLPSWGHRHVHCDYAVSFWILECI